MNSGGMLSNGSGVVGEAIKVLPLETVEPLEPPSAVMP
jgi:hypothetical protein